MGGEKAKGRNQIISGRWIDEKTRTLYEFQGCFYHGCITCFPNRGMKHPFHQNKTMKDAQEETRTKIERLSQLGYHVKGNVGV